jgi:hypothetical protein
VNANFNSSDQDLVRITEAGDTRFTEASDTRIITIAGNVGVLSMVSLPDKILFNSQVYTKVAGTWTQIVPSANLGSDWSLTNKMYRKQSGEWVRIY